MATTTTELPKDGEPEAGSATSPAGDHLPVRLVAMVKAWCLDRMWLWALPIYALLIWQLVEQLTPAWNYPPFGNDSWSFLEISRSVFSDPGRVDTYRWFGSTEPYTPVPLGWPAAIAVATTLTGQGNRSALIASGAVLVLAALFLDQAGRRLFGVRGFGPTLILCVLAFSWFTQDVVSIGAIPMQLMWFAAMLMVVANPWPLRGRHALLAGIFSGLAVMTRFDSLALVLVVPLVLLVLRAVRPAGVLRYGLGMAIAFAPWVLYSLLHFGTPWVSPYSSSILAAPFTTPIHYLPTPPPTLFSDPGAWWTRVSGGFDDLALHLDRVRIDSIVLVPLAVVATTALVTGIAVRAARDESSPLSARIRAAVSEQLRTTFGARGVKLFAALALASLLLNALSQVASSSFDDRYWASTLMLLEGLLLAVLLSLGFGGRVLGTLAVAGALLIGALPILQMKRLISYPSHVLRGMLADPEPAARQLSECIAPADVVLFYGFSGLAHVYGAVADDGQAVMFPVNWNGLSKEARQSFLDRYRVNLIYVDPKTSLGASKDPAARITKDLGGRGLEPTGCAEGLFIVSSG